MMKRAAKKESFVQAAPSAPSAPSAPKAAERVWYTVRWKYKDPVEGRPVGGAVEVFAPGTAAAKAEVKKMLDKRVRKWQGLTVEEGQRLPKPPSERDYHMDMLARNILAGDGRPVADRVDGPVVVPPARAHVITLLKLWGHGPLNDNGEKVRGYLDEHRSESFNRLVVRMAKGLKDMAQTWPSDRHPVVSWGELAEVLEQWHKEAGGRITKPKPAKEWDDLKTLALFHALRYAAGDRQANLSTNTEADKVARDAGYVSKGSGKILRSHFNTYRNEAGRTGKGVRSTEVLKRYDAVIPRLEKGSKALKLATKEGELVLSREH